MNRFCERCERSSQDGNLWCPERDCPAEANLDLLSYGDYIGDVKIIKLLRSWRTAAIYEAERNKTKLLIKVAHAGDDCADRLRREAKVFATLAPKPDPTPKFIKQFKRPEPRAVLLVPEPAYIPAPNNPYGEITFRGAGKVYSVFKHIEGKLLSDILLENPQVWHYEISWALITLIDALRPLVANKKSHLGLHPDMIMVDVDKEGHLRPVLLDLGFLLEGDEIRSVMQWTQLAEPAYTAPELMAANRSAHLAADVYSMGLIYYEMLAGHPGFEPKLYRDEIVRRIITQARRSPDVERPELAPAGVVKIVEKAIGSSNRFNSLSEMGEELKKIYGLAPIEKRPLPIKTKILLIVVGVLMVIAVIAAVVIGASAMSGILPSLLGGGTP